jgi:esterase/lipase
MPNLLTQISYSATATLLTQSIKLKENRLPLRNEGCRSQLLIQPQRASKVLLFFHGFTAAPYQFMSMGDGFRKAGYTVLVPLMPGHGQAGDWNATTPPPLPTDANVYKQFGLYWLQQARSLGNQVVVGGLSGGGTLAAWLAQERPQEIERALLFAPYLSSSSKVLDLFINIVNSYVKWQIPPGAQVVGYDGFQMNALKTLLHLGGEVLDRSAKQDSAPMFIISTEADRAVSNTDHRVLFDNILKRQPKSWYHIFDRVLNIPHTMMTKFEGNEWENLLNVMAKAYVQSDLTWAEVEEIAYRMTEGKTYPQVIAELNLQAKASPDMPAMITMLDKREIVIKRNPSNDLG